MEPCLPPACGSHQQFAAVEGRLRHLKVDQLVGMSWGMIHLTCVQNQVGFFRLFAQTSKISAGISVARERVRTRSGGQGGL